MPEKKASGGALSVLGSIVGAVGGWTLSEYCGLSLWIPGGACALLLLVFAKTPIKPRFFWGAIAATGGHLVWFVVGAILARSVVATGLDIVFLTAGIAWLWLRPGFGSTLYLGLLQLLSLGLNLVSIFDSPFGSASHRALSAHVAFRAIALICLGVGFWRWKKRPNQSPEPTPMSVTPPAAQESRQP